MGVFEVQKSDWKLFRQRLPGWQEAYMEKLVREYIELLTGDGMASKKFWELEKKINKDKRDCGVVVEMRRSNLIQILAELMLEGAITENDLEGFSEELKNVVFKWVANTR